MVTSARSKKLKCEFYFNLEACCAWVMLPQKWASKINQKPQDFEESDMLEMHPL